MGTLIKYELKKLFTKRMNIIALIVTLGLLLMFFRVEYKFTDSNGVNHEGKEAVALRKEVTKEISGELTNERIADEIAKLQEVSNNPDNTYIDEYGDKEFTNEVYKNYLERRLNLLVNINRVYAGYNTNYIHEISKINLDKTHNFYKTRLETLENQLDENYDGKTYSEAEKKYWLGKISDVNEPVKYEFFYGWSNIFNTYEIIIFGMVGICICLASVFAGEYQSGTDRIILSSKYGKSKVITSKIIASYIFASIVFTFFVICSLLSIISLFGIEGWNIAVQNYNFLIPFQYTFLQATLVIIGLSYIVLFGMVGFTLFLSSKMKNPIGVFGIDIVLMIVPALISISSPVGLKNKLLALLPYNASSISLTSMLAYPIGKVVISLPAMIIIVYVSLMIITPLLSRRAFKNHQVE